MTYAAQRLNITNNTPHPIKATVRLDGEDIHVAIGYDLAAQVLRDELLNGFGLPATIYGKPVVVQGDDAKSLAVRIDTLKREIAAEMPYAFVVWYVSGYRELYRPGNADLRHPDATFPPCTTMPDKFVPLFVPPRPSYHRGSMAHAVAMQRIRAGRASALIETTPGQWQLRDMDNNTWEVMT